MSSWGPAMRPTPHQPPAAPSFLEFPGAQHLTRDRPTVHRQYGSGDVARPLGGKYSAASAMSSGVPSRFDGRSARIVSRTAPSTSISSGSRLAADFPRIGVGMLPGAIALTRIPWYANSIAADW
jgi:hypothetical protein